MGDPRAARELLKGGVLPPDRQLVQGLTTPSLISGADTLSAALGAYMETVKERTVETARLLSETDVRLHKAEDDREDFRMKLKDKEGELFTTETENATLRCEKVEEKQRFEDEAKAREERVSQLKATLDRARGQRARWKDGYMRVRSLAADSVRLHQKSEYFKELVGHFSLQSFTEGALALREFVDEKVPGIDYTGADCLALADDVEIPEMDNDNMLRMLDAVFEGEELPASLELDGTPTTPQEGTTAVMAPPPSPNSAPSALEAEAEGDAPRPSGSEAP